jgi:hypothetical protein
MVRTLHESTFSYLLPTEEQKLVMEEARSAFANLATRLDQIVPAGPDKTFMLRNLRDCAMWANIAITRNSDGSPRT